MKSSDGGWGLVIRVLAVNISGHALCVCCAAPAGTGREGFCFSPAPTQMHALPCALRSSHFPFPNTHYEVKPTH